MKEVIIVAPMEANGRYRGGIMSVANTLFDNREQFLKYDIELRKFNTYIRNRKAETIGKLDLDNILNMFCIIKGLLKVTKKNGCDTLYYNSSIKSALLKDLLIIRILRLFGRKQKIVLHIHFAELDKILPNNTLIRKWMLRTLENKVDKIIYLSTETKKEFEIAGISFEKGVVIYNFHNGRIEEPAVLEKQKECLKKKQLDYIFMGSIEHRKGILDLLEAMKKCTQYAKLHICGSCSDETVKEKYKHLINELGNCVVDHGFVTGSEKDQLMRQADCLVLPSYGEGFPLVLVDAMAYGCSCITTPVGAVPEFFSEKNGYIFDAGNIEMLSRCIASAASSRVLTVEQMYTNYVDSKKFSLECFIESLQKVL